MVVGEEDGGDGGSIDVVGDGVAAPGVVIADGEALF